MRKRRVSCKLRGSRGSIANKRLVELGLLNVWLCYACVAAVLASADLGTRMVATAIARERHALPPRNELR